MDNATDTISDGYDLALNKFQEWGREFYLMLPNLFVGLFILILFGVIAFAVNRILRTYFVKRARIDLGRLLGQFAFWLLILLGALVAMTIVVPSMKPVDLISGLGLGSLAIGFAFKDILQNWLAGLLILLRLPFRRGDQIEINGLKGTVLRIEPRATIIRTYDGKDIVIPNTQIYTNDVTIQTSQPTRRVEMEITVGYEHPVERVRQVLLKALDPIEEIKKDPEPQVLCWELGATSLGMKIRWWISSERSQEVISRARAVEAIKAAFEANDIDPTDPSLVYSVNAHPDAERPDAGKDGKKSAKAESPVKSGQVPAKIGMDKDDPETYTSKQDEKSQTLLTDTKTV